MITQDTREAIGHLKSVTGRTDLTDRILREISMLDAMTGAQAKQIEELQGFNYRCRCQIEILESQVSRLEKHPWNRMKAWWAKHRRRSPIE